jgi:hypothetical protein
MRHAGPFSITTKFVARKKPPMKQISAFHDMRTSREHHLKSMGCNPTGSRKLNTPTSPLFASIENL